MVQMTGDVHAADIEEHLRDGVRLRVCQAAKAKNPNRWSGATRNWVPIHNVTLNPEKTPKEKNQAA
jgi:putative transposase